MFGILVSLVYVSHIAAAGMAYGGTMGMAHRCHKVCSHGAGGVVPSNWGSTLVHHVYEGVIAALPVHFVQKVKLFCNQSPVGGQIWEYDVAILQPLPFNLGC